MSIGTRNELMQQFPALTQAIEGFRNPYSEQSYREVEAAYDELMALREQIATAEQMKQILQLLLLQIASYQCAVDDITSTFSHHALQDDCACKWCTEQREVLLLDDAIAVARKCIAKLEAAEKVTPSTVFPL